LKWTCFNSREGWSGDEAKKNYTTRGKTELKWICFNCREGWSQLSSWEMQANKNYNSDRDMKSLTRRRENKYKRKKKLA